MCMNTFIIILLTLLLCVIVHGDVYMNQPRGSNNKLNEVSDLEMMKNKKNYKIYLKNNVFQLQRQFKMP
jgi:predicted transcriptional regulator